MENDPKKEEVIPLLPAHTLTRVLPYLAREKTILDFQDEMKINEKITRSKIVLPDVIYL